MSQHTPEPWATQSGGIIYSKHLEWRAPWAINARDTGRRYPAELQEANARRIVACVNRLEGFDTSDIENPSIDLFGVSSLQHRANMAEASLHAARCQRDELLATLLKYARHRSICASKYRGVRAQLQCDCGFDEAIAKAVQP